VEAIVFRSRDIGRLAVAEAPRWLTFGRPSVYLDSTIPSYLGSTLSRDALVARCQRITRIWWKRYRRDYEVLVSTRVMAEVTAGAPDLAKERLALVRTMRSLDCEAHHLELARSLLRPGVLPLKARADAEHIAIAACNSVRFLLTWNCQHLANPMIARKIAQICEAHALECPMICTPETLMRISLNERSDHQSNSRAASSADD